MLSRRELITAGVAGGFYAAPHSDAAARAVSEPPDATAAEEQQADREGQREIARRVAEVDQTLSRALLTNSLSFGHVGRVRDQMQQFFRGQAKFPDFIDVGIAVFMDVNDWHVKNQQQMVVTRAPDGRYWLQFMFTTLVVRPEVEPNYISAPYDKA